MARSRKEIAKQRRERLNPTKYLKGGVASDAFDIISTPLYAVGGLLSEKGVREGIRTATGAGEALGLKGAARFAADVALDPATYLSFGTSNVAKGALKGATLGKQASLGQRAVVSAFGKSLLPKAVDEAVFNQATKLGNRFKSTKPGQYLQRTFNLTPGAGKEATLDEIENLAKTYESAKAVSLKAQAAQRTGKAEAVDFGLKVSKSLKKVSEKDLIKVVDEASSLATTGKSVVKDLDPKLALIAKNLAREAKLITDARKSKGLATLEGKAFPLIPNAASKEYLDQLGKQAGGSPRIAGGASGSSNFATLAKIGDTLTKSTASGRIAKGVNKGEKFAKIGDEYFRVPTKAAAGVNRVIADLNKLKSAGNDFDIKNIDSVQSILKEKRGYSIINPEAIDQVKKIITSPALKRTGVDAPEFNRLASASDKIGFRASTNPAELIAESKFRLAKDVAKKNFINDIISEVAIPKPKGVLPKGWGVSSLPELKDFMMPLPIVEHIDKTYKAVTSVSELKTAIEYFDKTQNVLKGVLTILNPAFSFRNAVSNTWQLWLAGVNPLNYATGIRTAGEIAVFGPSKLKGSARKYWNEYIDEGLFGGGWVLSDIDQAISSDLKASNILGKPFKAGAKVSSFVEDSAKLSLYIDRRLKGFSPREASLEVRKYLFDYGDLSDIEKALFKRVFPFYTWTRKNLPLQIAMLIQKPGKQSIVPKAKDAVESLQEDKPLDEKYIPDWIKKGYPIYFGKDGKGSARYFRLQGFVPTVDIGFFDNPAKNALSQLSPLIQKPIEYASNYSFFFDKAIEDYQGQPGRLFNQDIPSSLGGVKTEYFLKTIRPLAEFDRLLDNSVPEEDRFAKFFFGAKLQSLNPVKQRALYDYLQSIEEAKIEKAIRKSILEGRSDRAKLLQDRLRKNQIEFTL